MPRPSAAALLRDVLRARRVPEARRIAVDAMTERLYVPSQPSPGSANGRVLKAALDHLETIEDTDIYLRRLQRSLEGQLTPTGIRRKETPA